MIRLLRMLGSSMVKRRRLLVRLVRVTLNVVRRLLRLIVSGVSIPMRRTILRMVLVRAVRVSVICRLNISVKVIRRIILRLRLLRRRLLSRRLILILSRLLLLMTLPMRLRRLLKVLILLLRFLVLMRMVNLRLRLLRVKLKKRMRTWMLSR